MAGLAVLAGFFLGQLVHCLIPSAYFQILVRFEMDRIKLYLKKIQPKQLKQPSGGK